MKKRQCLSGRVWKRISQVTGLLVLVGVVWSSFVFLPTDIAGNSMFPTLQNGDKMLVNTQATINRFDIVVFRDTGMKPVVKRVIGLPGDTLYVHNGELFINGIQTPEPYLKSLGEGDNGLQTSNFVLSEITESPVVPENEYFVMGDNRRDSYDSRHYGTIREEAVIGEAQMIYYPVKHITFFRSSTRN